MFPPVFQYRCQYSIATLDGGSTRAVTLLTLSRDLIRGLRKLTAIRGLTTTFEQKQKDLPPLLAKPIPVSCFPSLSTSADQPHCIV